MRGRVADLGELLGDAVERGAVDAEVLGEQAQEALAARLAQVEIGLAKRRRAPARRNLAAPALEALAHLPAQGLAVGVRQVGAQRAAVAGDVRDAAPGVAQLVNQPGGLGGGHGRRFGTRRAGAARPHRVAWVWQSA